MKIFRSVIIDAPIDDVWAAVRDFDGVVKWNPGVTAARMETGTATAVGSVRHLDIVDGTVFRETLLAHSDMDYSYSYDIIEGPLPCASYISTNCFLPITDGDKTLGIWEGEFDCSAEAEESMENIVGDQIYLGGMRGLNEYLKGNN
jgi:hypothetical protein